MAVTSVLLDQSEVVIAIRDYLTARGWNADRADVRFEQVGARHADGIDVKSLVVGVERDSDR